MKHNKGTRSFIAVLLVISLFAVTGIGNRAYATSEEIKSQIDFPAICETMNEYEVISILAEQSTNDLLAIGYTYQEIQDIRNYKQLYTEHIEELSNLDTNVLKAHGYSISQIYDIKNFTGNEEQISNIAAYVELNAEVSRFGFDGEYTRGTFIYSWKWHGIPQFKLKDIVAVGWNDWKTESERSTVSYMNIETGQYIYSKSATFSSENVATNGVAHKFSVSEDSNYSYASTGNGSFTFRSDTHCRKDLYFYASYGHSRFVMTDPSFSVSFSGFDPSVSFTGGVHEEDFKNGEVICH